MDPQNLPPPPPPLPLVVGAVIDSGATPSSDVSSGGLDAAAQAAAQATVQNILAYLMSQMIPSAIYAAADVQANEPNGMIRFFDQGPTDQMTIALALDTATGGQIVGGGLETGGQIVGGGLATGAQTVGDGVTQIIPSMPSLGDIF